MYYIVKEKETDIPGVTIEHAWTYDNTSIRDCFDEEFEDIDDMEKKIDDGDLDWFVARVRVLYDGIELGNDYLGGNLYEDVDDAFENGLDGYLEDMEIEAMDQAKVRLEKLVELKELL